MSDRQIITRKIVIARSKNIARAKSIAETNSNQKKIEQKVFVSTTIEETNDSFRSRSSSCSKIN